MKYLTIITAATAFSVLPTNVDSSATKPEISSRHHIECWNVKGEMVRSFDNDPTGPFYAIGTAITFLDMRDHLMHRLMASNCDVTWAPKDTY